MGTNTARSPEQWIIRGADVLDVASGEVVRRDLAVSAGQITTPGALADAREADASGLTALFGLWDCHAHPGSLMYDLTGQSYFEGPAEWAVRAGQNLMEAAQMGVHGRPRGRGGKSRRPGLVPGIRGRRISGAARPLRGCRDPDDRGSRHRVPASPGGGGVGDRS